MAGARTSCTVLGAVKKIAAGSATTDRDNSSSASANTGRGVRQPPPFEKTDQIWLALGTEAILAEERPWWRHAAGAIDYLFP
jgi:hypothetical protein